MNSSHLILWRPLLTCMSDGITSWNINGLRVDFGIAGGKQFKSWNFIFDNFFFVCDRTVLFFVLCGCGKLSMRNRTLADMIHTLRIINIHDNFRHGDVIAHKFLVYVKMRELYNLWMKMNLSLKSKADTAARIMMTNRSEIVNLPCSVARSSLICHFSTICVNFPKRTELK